MSISQTLADHDPPSLAERYGLATQSSHLRCEEGNCDLDFMIAAGMAADPLGAALLRLRVEFDAAKAVTRETLNRTEFVLLLAGLGSLASVRAQLGVFASSLATKSLFMRPDSAVMVIAGRVLDVWLDPQCHSCDGRGFNGGAHRGEQKIKCGGCAGLGQRRAMLGDSMEERRFARLLLDALHEVLRRAEDQIGRKLREAR